MISPGHRRRLNRALHEVRRPLQTLALMDEGSAPALQASPPGAARRGLLELAASALVVLDGQVNGSEVPRSVRTVGCRELVLASLERWRGAVPDGSIRLFWDAGPAPVEGDPVAISQGLDNLIANAIEHGGPPVVLTGAKVAGRVRITLANGRAGEERAPRDRDPRRGHGVGLVADMAARHSGRFAICETSSGCVAALELPLAQTELPMAA